jgi:hypothetical protein
MVIIALYLKVHPRLFHAGICAMSGSSGEPIVIKDKYVAQRSDSFLDISMDTSDEDTGPTRPPKKNTMVTQARVAPARDPGVTSSMLTSLARVAPAFSTSRPP